MIWRCLGTAFGHLLLGSHNLMVTALGSCVKWSLGPILTRAHVGTPMYLNKFVVLYRFMYVHLNLCNITLFDVTPLLYPKSLRNICVQFKSPFMLSHFLPIYHKI